MSIIVEHDKRRHEILEKALDVFIEEGFEDVTFQKISDKCDITRTTLYTYFRNKSDIFNYSIKQFMQILENEISEIRKKKALSHSGKLTGVMTVIIDRLEENSRLLSVVVDYLLNSTKGGFDPSSRVRRRTVRLRHILTTMLIEGIKAGEFAPSINVKEANELLYSFLESAVLRMVVLRRTSVDEIKPAVKLAVGRLSVNV